MIRLLLISILYFKREETKGRWDSKARRAPWTNTKEQGWTGFRKPCEQMEAALSESGPEPRDAAGSGPKAAAPRAGIWGVCWSSSGPPKGMMEEILHQPDEARKETRTVVNFFDPCSLCSWRRIKALLWILVNKFHVCPILCRAYQPPMTGSSMNAQNVAISPWGCVCRSQSGKCSQRVDFPPAAHSRAPQCTTDPPSHCMFSPQSFLGASSPESRTLYFFWKKAEREVSTVQRPRTREIPLPQLLVRRETLGNPEKSLP